MDNLDLDAKIAITKDMYKLVSTDINRYLVSKLTLLDPSTNQALLITLTSDIAYLIPPNFGMNIKDAERMNTWKRIMLQLVSSRWDKSISDCLGHIPEIEREIKATRRP